MPEQKKKITKTKENIMNYFTLACFAYKLIGRRILKKLISTDKTKLGEKLLEELDKVAAMKIK